MKVGDEIACIILAGGQGERMASTGQHKACFSIVGRPAIVRAIETYKAAGLRRFMVVVGQMAEQVIATVSAAHPEVSFVFQAEPFGTGHATAVATEALAAQGNCTAVMVTMGDKIIRPKVVRNLLERFCGGNSDVVLTTLPKESGPASGRVITDGDGSVLGIVEKADIDDARRRRSSLMLAGRKRSPVQLEKGCDLINPSLYLFRFDRLREALSQLRSDNAQGELYLTDTIGVLSSRGRVEIMRVEDPTDLMAFNTPAELLAIEDVVGQREKPPRVRLAGKKTLTGRVLKPAGRWAAVTAAGGAKWLAELRRTYGKDQGLLVERQKAIKRLIKAFVRRFGADRPMILCRAPGRVNMMGRHVDHRGGHVNVMAFSREVLLAAAIRQDDAVHLENLDPKRFPTRQFRISDLLRDYSWSDWIDFVDSKAVKLVLDTTHADWSNYARASLLRLQHECRDVRLRGMDCLVSGNIPVGAGLSSSSALVVAFAEAAVALNGLNVAARDFINLCGEGEWFAGSRRGNAEHAAIRTGRTGHISRIGFFPFRMEGEVRFPTDLRVVIAYSGSMSAGSGRIRDVFDQRVACYDLAELFLQRHWPPAASIEHLRDLTPDRLKVPPGEIYHAVMQLPVRPTRRKLRKMFGPADQDRLEQIFTTHPDQGPYDLRGVTLFGLGEIIRSEQFADVLRKGDMLRIRRFLQTSHNGERRMSFAPDGASRRFVVRTDDATLERLAAERVPLTDQCGRYACSTDDVDLLVDLADATEGVIGSQLAGPGLGGCMMILVRADALGRLMRRLRKCFYRPRGLSFDAFVCTPVSGAGLLGV